MNIGFIFTEGFPVGMAGTNRLLSLAKGLVENGHNVKVFCVRPTEKRTNILNKHAEGIHQGIHFIYTGGNIFWPDKKLHKLTVFLKSVMGSIPALNKWRKQSGTNVIITPCYRLSLSVLYGLIARLWKVPFVLTVDEFPVVLRYKTNPFRRGLYLRLYPRLFDGVVSMTKILMTYYGSRIRRGVPMVHIPMTVEPQRFLSNPERVTPPTDRYIAYCGNLGHNGKDGVPILIRAFQKIHPGFPSIKLYILGGARDGEQFAVDQLKELVDSLELAESIVFTGQISRELMPAYLCNADVLALARPDNLQAKGGFPTKLGEYLMTSKPVVVTDVGEIGEYLTHGESAFIAEPDSVEDFASKLEDALGDKERASRIGKRGRDVAMQYFDYQHQGQVFSEFLERLGSGDGV